MSDTPLLDAIRAEAQRQAALLPKSDSPVRMHAFAVKTRDDVQIGVGALIGDDVAVGLAVLDTVKDGRLRADEIRLDFTIGTRR